MDRSAKKQVTLGALVLVALMFGAGFGMQGGKGKVRLPRLKHADRNWDKNFGTGGDINMLVQFRALTQINVAEKTEVLDIAQLARLRGQQAPPLVLVTGANSFRLTPAEKKDLKNYLLEKSGMILGDNLGGASFHNQFIQTMREVTGVQEVAIPRDDSIHAKPFKLPSLPIVVAHGGTDPLGWKVEGRWVAYYHPGALTDAWRDDHAGIKRDIWESCYQLGSNIIFYAYSEKDKWIEAQKSK